MTTSTNKTPYANMVLMHDLRTELEAQRKYTHGLEASEAALLAHVAHLKTELATLRAAAERVVGQYRSPDAGYDSHAIQLLDDALAQTAPHENPYAELIAAAVRVQDMLKESPRYNLNGKPNPLHELDAAIAKVTR